MEATSTSATQGWGFLGPSSVPQHPPGLLPLQLIAGSDSFNDAELHEQDAIQAKAHTNCRAAQASCNADKGTHRAGRDITPSTGKHAKQLNMDKHADLRQDLAGMQGCGEPTAQHTPPGF